MRRKPEIVFQDVQATIRNLSAFTLVSLAEMARIDKFEATDVGSSSEGPKPKHSISDPVGARVVAKLSGRKVSDPVGNAVKEIDRALFEMRRASEVLTQQMSYVLNPRERHRAMTTPQCAACGRDVAGTSNDRIRSGYGYGCYRDWLKEGKPNRTAFEARIRESGETC